ncbi:MAG: amidohydrolase family protein [Bacteroidota bacterium]
MNAGQRQVIDAHVHLAEDRLADAVRIMDRNGIEAAVDATPIMFAAIQSRLAAFGRYPARFHACYGVDPAGFGTAAWTKRECDHLAKAAEMGVVGVKFNKRWGLSITDGQGRLIPIDHDALDPIYDRIGRLGLAVIFHVGDPKAFFRKLDAKNERYQELKYNPDWSFADRRKYPYDWWRLVRQIEKVVRRHTKTRFIGAHFGCAAEEIGYVADVMRDNPNYHVDLAARIGELGRHEPEQVRDVFLEFQDRILFGTDLGVRKDIMLGSPQDFDPSDRDIDAFYEAHWRYFETEERGIPHPTPIQGNWTVDAIGLGPEVLAKIYRDNAKRLLTEAAPRSRPSPSAAGGR